MAVLIAGLVVMDSNKKKKKKTKITDLHKDLVPQILSWLPTKATVVVSYLFSQRELAY